jgi:hypothetical protein
MTTNFSDAAMRLDATPEQYRGNVEALARLAERVRTAGGNIPMVPTSVWRSATANRLAGGSTTSQHLTGSALDFEVKTSDKAAWFKRVVEAMPADSFGQLIFYQGTSEHVHVSLPNRASGKRGEVLIQTGPKTYANYITNAPATDPADNEGLFSALRPVVLLFMLSVLAWAIVEIVT